MHGGISELLSDKELSETLRKDAALHVGRHVFRLHEVPLFQKCAEQDSDFVSALVLKLHVNIFLAGEIIIRKGAVGREMYVVIKGLAGVIADQAAVDKEGMKNAAVKLPDGRYVLAPLKPGDFFGEVALVTDARRTVEVQALDACELVVLHKHDFYEVLTEFPDLASEVMIHTRAKQMIKDGAGVRGRERRLHPQGRTSEATSRA